LLRFGGRAIPSANAFKNVLGIFPKGWKVPLSYRHKTATRDVLVRLAGVHTKVELEAMAAKMASPPGAERKEPPKSEEPKPDQKPKPNGKPRLPIPGLKPKPEPLTEIVKKHYEAKRGFINYHFNQVERDRVWKGFIARGDYSGLAANWRVSGVLSGGGDFVFNLASDEAALEMPGGNVKAPLKGNLSESFDPPGSGGLLVTMGLWRRLLALGPEKFGDVAYLGTMPLYRSSIHDPPTEFGPEFPLADVYTAQYGGVDLLFHFDAVDGLLALVEMFPDDLSDPCEVHLGDYREVEGRMWPHRIEVRYADAVYNLFQAQKFSFQKDRTE
jgi:serine protease Do